MGVFKGIKRVIARVGQRVFGRVRWLNLLARAGHLTKDAYYNQLTEILLQRSLTPTSTCVDVGCSRGDILEMMVKYAPRGRFLAFEPLPDHYEELVKKFPFSNIQLYNVALSDRKGMSSFNYVISNPAYSGLKKRPYDRPHEEDTQIEVRTERLDDVLRAAMVDDLDVVKIDVEGAEYLVIKGAAQAMRMYRPVVIFEHGPGAAKAYETKSEDLYALLVNTCGLKVSLLQDRLAGKPPLSKEQFCQNVYSGANYYFVAHE
ncbi:MAG: FkbM family methyltransferase [Planctomycetaceae bacterium]|nr:FkbM family methyltransferase [Planctomycetaceae bacterium]